jgi:glycosyltransferase involved in cell wall biosynthesis
MATVLFYKRLVMLGGAEVLMGQHYAWLKAQGEDVTVLSFEVADVDRVALDPTDLVVVKGAGVLAQTCALVAALKKSRGSTVICHSGYLELGVAAWLAGVDFSIFVHQPTTMSFNEQDKFAARLWPRYQAFARHDAMYDQLCAQRARQSLPRRLYIEARSFLSQAVLRRARARFVLSNYAVHEKRQIFGWVATFLAGAITPERVSALAGKSDLKPVGKTIELVSVSRLDKNKRIEILIDAVAELRARGRAVRLRLGGKGPATKYLKAHAAKLGVADAVEFLGFIPEDEIPGLYASMDLFASIDWADFRITTYEVLAENRRVIVSDDTDVAPDLLASGYLFAAAPEAEVLADCIERALQTPVTWGRARLAEYLSTFTWPVYFDRIAQAIANSADQTSTHMVERGDA